MKRLLILLALTPTTTWSQTQNLDAIEVTEVRGNKDERTFIESNESISVLKPKNLNRGDLPNSVQMLNGFANVQTQTDRAGDTFSIRGVSDMGVTGFQKDNLATILVDDIFQTSLAVRAGSFENWDLDSVEIRRGAQSTDQGVNSLAGNILLYHNAPKAQNEGQAKLTYGNFNRREGAFVLNRQITDKFSFRTSYNKEDNDGFIKNGTTKNDKWGERKKDHFVTDFLYRLSENSSVRLNLKALRMHKGGSYVQNYKKLKVLENQDYKEITNNQQAGLTLMNKLSDNWSNKFILGATRGSSTAKSDEDGTAVDVAGTRNGNDKDQFLSLENQLKYRSEKIKNVLGVHLHRYNLDSFYNFRLMFTTMLNAPVTQENSKTRETYAIFDSFTYDFNRHHAVNIGSRLEVVKNKFSADIDSSAAPAPYNALSGKYGDTNTNTVALPKLQYTYRNDNYSLGSTYSQGYRTGGISVNRARATTNEYSPERTHNYELSWKYMQDRLLVAANTFYTKWKDQQVEVIGSSSFDTQVKNAAESELYGAELETSYELENNDSVRMNVGYVHTRFLSFKNAGKVYTGNAFPDAAPLTAQASYWKILNDKWMVILVQRYVSESFTDPDNLRWAPEQFYTDLNTQYSFDQYMIEGYVRNVFDQGYRLFNGSPRSTTTPYQANYHRVSTPRELGVRLNYYW